MARVYVVGTADTKGEELAYLADRIAAAGGAPLRVDVGTRSATVTVDVPAAEIAAFHPAGADAVLATDDRGIAVSAMGEAYKRFMASRNDVSAIVGIGGGGGTSIITAGMRDLPLGLPKIMVSTLASGDVSAYVGVSDIMMMPSVTDMAGLNRLSRVILDNAAVAITAMANRPALATESRPALGLTMFGVTTACVTNVVAQLKDRYDCMVFHATGTGGRAMEKLADSGMLEGIIDVTTTEVCDLLFGGVLPATEDRFGAVIRTKLPYVCSVGALDMVNFWAVDTVPAKYSGRNLYKHNPNVTLMRTTPEECDAIGRWIGGKLNLCDGQVRLLIPEKGISALDRQGGAFFDPEADAALFAAIENTVQPTSNRRIIRLPHHINDPEFADALVTAYREIANA
jgi:uncharacterized protein (UPF0261 family)